MGVEREVVLREVEEGDLFGEGPIVARSEKELEEGVGCLRVWSVRLAPDARTSLEIFELDAQAARQYGAFPKALLAQIRARYVQLQEELPLRQRAYEQKMAERRTRTALIAT